MTRTGDILGEAHLVMAEATSIMAEADEAMDWQFPRASGIRARQFELSSKLIRLAHEMQLQRGRSKLDCFKTVLLIAVCLAMGFVVGASI